ncbi:MAG: hypothetical protein Q9179_004531 [Wetmoreana sp. 5 TL-2023]
MTLVIYQTRSTSVTHIIRACEIVISLISTVLILCMPLRDPNLPDDDISRPFEKPNHLLRSPEDKLTLWQFMSVSWMSPLISVGYTRQLNDDDVWNLSFEFQHGMLHQKFRELAGSVVRRLLSANGLDLVILSCLGIVEALSSMCDTHSQDGRQISDTCIPDFAGPVLLQQLLRAMEDAFAPRSRAVTFAVLSLLVRLIACQSSVFSLWYSRRCYERSRGEMITMLYEKTLSRKLLGESAQTRTSNLSAADHDGAISTPTGLSKATQGHVGFARDYIKRLGRFLTRSMRVRFSREKSEQSTSIGKIYNLMR